MEFPDFFRLFVRPVHASGLRDVRGMLLVNPEKIDRAMLDTACAELGLIAQWQRAQTG